LKLKKILPLFVAFAIIIVSVNIYNSIRYENWLDENEVIIEVIETNANEVGVDSEPYKKEAFETDKNGNELNFEDFSQSSMMMDKSTSQLSSNSTGGKVKKIGKSELTIPVDESKDLSLNDSVQGFDSLVSQGFECGMTNDFKLDKESLGIQNSDYLCVYGYETVDLSGEITQGSTLIYFDENSELLGVSTSILQTYGWSEGSWRLEEYVGEVTNEGYTETCRVDSSMMKKNITKDCAELYEGEILYAKDKNPLYNNVVENYNKIDNLLSNYGVTKAV
jgi:hypothetical protein